MSNRIENITTPKQEGGDITLGQAGDISSGIGINNERMALYSKLGTLPQDTGANGLSLQPIDLVTQDPQDIEKFKGAALKKEANPVDFTIVDDFGNKQEVVNKNYSSELSKPEEFIDRDFDISNDPGRLPPFIDHGFGVSNDLKRNAAFANDGFSVSEILKQAQRPARELLLDK